MSKLKTAVYITTQELVNLLVENTKFGFQYHGSEVESIEFDGKNLNMILVKEQIIN